MNRTRPLAFWIAILAASVAAIVVMRQVLLPFVAGMVLAYLLDPLATRLERLGMNRLLATLFIVALFIVTAVVSLVLMAPIILNELAYFLEKLPVYVRQLQALAIDPSRPWLSRIIGDGLGYAESSIGQLTTMVASWFDAFLHSVWSAGRAFITMFSLFVVAPIVAFNLIYDWNRMIAAVDNWVPPARRGVVRALAREIDDTIRGFVRGQSALCLILALFYAAALSLTGLEHGILIGISAGLLSFVPYLGALTGLVASTCVAIAQFWPDWKVILFIAAVFFIGQSVSDYVLASYFIGRRVHLNPVWMIFALFAFGYLFGFVGLLIAEPVAAAIGVLLRFALRQYYASPLYDDTPTTSALEIDTSKGASE